MKMSTPKLLALISGVIVLVGVGMATWAYRSGYYYALQGGMAQSNGQIDEAILLFKQGYAQNPEAYMVASDIAGCYSLKGDTATCIVWLRKALETRHAGDVRKSARTDPDFNNVRPSKEFKELIEKAP